MDTPEKLNANDSISNNTLLSTEGVSILDSMEETVSCCSNQNDNCLEIYEKPGYTLRSYVEKFIETKIGPVPVIKTRLGRDDLFSTFYVRCGIRRHRYTVSPGLYAIGNPDKDSEVLVTANFKLTFDVLRKELGGVSVWILVLDTKGVNVWCAAGKGTFSTRDLVKRIKDNHLEKIVNHKRVIVPQLGAAGVSARDVKKQSQFRVIYGPIRASDIRAFLKNGKKVEKQMRLVTFTMYERFILTPVEIQIILKPALITAVVLLLLSGIGPGIFSFSSALQRGSVSILALAAGIFAGAFVTPVLLPYIPFRKFALKGIIAGSIVALITILAAEPVVNGMAGYLALFLFSVTISSYLAMNFTGATPFTSPSGVEKEMKQYIPVQLAGLVISLGLWIYSAF
jgi:hypothetical protein